MVATPPMPDFPEVPRRPERGNTASGDRKAGAGGESGGGPMRFASLGIELVAYVVVAGGIGFAIDKWRGGGAAWTVGGLLFGLVGGSVRFVRAALRAIREE